MALRFPFSLLITRNIVRESRTPFPMSFLVNNQANLSELQKSPPSFHVGVEQRLSSRTTTMNSDTVLHYLFSVITSIGLALPAFLLVVISWRVSRLRGLTPGNYEERVNGSVAETLKEQIDGLLTPLFAQNAVDLLAGLVLSSCHTGTDHYVFIDDLSRAVQQFYHGSGSGGFSNPTPPPGNSGFALLPPPDPLQAEPEASQAQKNLVNLLKKHLLRYCADRKVAQKFPALQYQEMSSLAEDLALTELEVGGKPDAEIAGLTAYLNPFTTVKSFFDAFFANRFEE